MSTTHLLAIPVSDEHLWEISARWIAEGLCLGERVLYFEDDTADAVLGRLADDRVPVDEAIADGQLSIVPGEQTRGATSGPATRVEEMFLGQIADATEAGWTGVRFSGNSASGLLGHGGFDLVEYEQRLEVLLQAHPQARSLCTYGPPRFPDEAITALAELHDVEFADTALYDDTLLRVTPVGPTGARLAGEVDRSNRRQVRHLVEQTLDRALRSHSAPSDVTLDLASLRFVDVAGAVGLVHAAEEFPSTHRLVLTGIRPRVLRVLDRCGAPFAAQLVLRPRAEE